MSNDDRTPAQVWADHMMTPTPAPADPAAQPINPATDNLNALHERREGSE